MITPTKTLLRKSRMRILRMAMLSSLAAATPFLAAHSAVTNDSEQVNTGHEHDDHEHAAPAKLVQIVRDATRQFLNINALAGTDYQPAFGCVSGPDHGAMGVHYVSQSLVGDGEIDATRPEALIYEPLSDGRMRLVGVEFIVDAATWLAAHPNTPPMLEGQAFQFVASPNRFALPDFFELHVWAWRDNPKGAFVDWNTKVTCEGQ